MTQAPHETALPQPQSTLPSVADLPDEGATARLGAALAVGLVPGLSVYLHGQLGAGKTTLVRAVLAALGWRGRVKSPTYTLVELYPVSRLNLYHFDFYRFRDRAEWRDAGFSEYFGGDGVCFVEWPEMAGDELPPPDLDITLQVLDASEHAKRRATLVAHTAAGRACLKRAALSTSPGASS